MSWRFIFELFAVLLGVAGSPWLLRGWVVRGIDRLRLKVFTCLDVLGFGVGTGIHFVSGVPGGGKSLWVHCEYIIAELLTGRRIVVTNFKFGKKIILLRQWMAKHNIPDWRLQLIEDEQCRDFYFHRYRNGLRSGITIPYRFKDLTKQEWSSGKLPRWGLKTGDAGILYVLEETANIFRAKEWAQFPPSATFYLSQHRKFGDGVVVLTQDVDLISLDFRRLAQDFTYLQNYGQSTFRKISVGRLFEARKYLHPVTRGSGRGTAVLVKVFRLNKELANLYETDAGVGVIGRGADTSWKPKGIPFPVLIAALCLLAFGGWWIVTKGSSYMAQKVINQGNSASNAIKGMALNRGGDTSAVAPAHSASSVPAGSGLPHQSRPVALVGYARTSDGAGVFFFSDGTMLDNPSGTFDGQTLRLTSGQMFRLTRSSPGS